MSEKHVTDKNKDKTKNARKVTDKKNNTVSHKYSYLLPERFVKFPWAQWIDMPYSDDKSPLDPLGHFPEGKLFCGICTTAVGNGCYL